MRFSFRKCDRLLKRTEFLQLTQTGRKIQNAHFIVMFGVSRVNRSRLGITVTRKVGNAAKRNAVKRRAREFFRLNRQTLKGDWDINVIAKKEAGELSSPMFFGSLQNLFERIS
ncbi:MAG: ribonuclease P protein component [Desulfobacterales bacterium]|nr:MAG: ribonuclease P protein component [Desulfobacterales bacterium]